MRRRVPKCKECSHLLVVNKNHAKGRPMRVCGIMDEKKIYGEAMKYSPLWCPKRREESENVRTED
jgi:hypothetical protein